MGVWVKVPKSVYLQMEDSAEICNRGFGFNVAGEETGRMEVIEFEEDNIWCDYYVREDFYRNWRESVAVFV